MATFPSFHQELLTRARRLFTLNRCHDARRELTQLLHLGGVPAAIRCQARRLLGEVELELENPKEAARHLKAALELDPTLAEVHVLYGQALLGLSRRPSLRALRALRRATQIQPTEPRYWALLGRSLIDAGREQLALRAFRQAMRRRPTTFAVIADIVDGLVRLGRLGRAERFLRLSIFRVPRLPGLHDLVSRLRYERLRLEMQQEEELAESLDILPFKPVEPTEGSFPSTPRTVRYDRRSRSTPHLFRRHRPPFGRSRWGRESV